MLSRIMVLLVVGYGIAGCDDTGIQPDSKVVADLQTNQDTAGAEDSGPGDTGTDGFQPGKAGHFINLTLGVAKVLGQNTASLIVGFRQAAREDFEHVKDWTDVPVDSCELSAGPPTDACKQKQDCAPEQECEPTEYDADGKPVPGSLRCVTPLPALDIGPMTFTGLKGGPVTLSYNSGQQGAYTTPGSDGTIPFTEVVYETKHEFNGQGDATQGVGAFSGELRTGPDLSLTSPKVEDVGMGMPGIKVSPSQDLTLVWTGKMQEGYVRISLKAGSGAAENALLCRAMDDGEFTITKDQLAKLKLNGIAVFNRLAISRITPGGVSDLFTASNISTVQAMLIFVQPI